ncbi:MAG: hypothetical protein HYY48_05470 [Gammaproteobacteria bacterium]|nr:hypothetical protein [Gammaproteobacteria bacterium]
MSIPKGWVVLRTVPSSPEASVLGAFLEQNGVPVHLEQLGELPGLECGAMVAVPGNLLHRAQWLTAEQHISEEELADLAVGLPRSEAEK